MKAPVHTRYPAVITTSAWVKMLLDAPIGHLWFQHGGGASVAVTGNGAETHANVIMSLNGVDWIDAVYGQASKTWVNSFAPVGETTPAAYTTYSGNFVLNPDRSGQYTGPEHWR